MTRFVDAFGVPVRVGAFGWTHLNRAVCDAVSDWDLRRMGFIESPVIAFEVAS